jgi:Zn-finger nucleic acid-binding protein
VSAGCPRCQKPLEEAQLDNLTARICRDCKGMLLAHEDLMNVIDASWRAVTEKSAEETQFHVKDAARTDPVLRCPDCGQPMEKYGYMGMLAIQIDRCERCSLVWLDADELQNMVLAFAKDNYRSGAREKVTADAFDPLLGQARYTRSGDCTGPSALAFAVSVC